MTTKLTTKQQYNLALQCMRLVRAYNRERVYGLRMKELNIAAIREVLHYSIDRQVLDAAVRTLVQQRYDNTYYATRTMSNWLLTQREADNVNDTENFSW
jgi:hypothetical protein